MTTNKPCAFSLAELRALHRPPERSWDEVLGPRGYIKNCTALHRDEPEHWQQIASICRRLGLPYAEKRWIAMCYPDVIRRAYAFLDGGVHTQEGPYWGGAHGAWVSGTRAFRFLCYVLGLKQPRHLTGEERVPLFDELCVEINRQRKQPLDELKEWVARRTGL